jgi:hypothetical protein
MGAAAENLPDVMAKLSNVGARLTAYSKQDILSVDFEHAEVVDAACAEKAPNGGTQRWSLVDGADKLGTDGAYLVLGEFVVQVHHADVFLACAQEEVGDFRAVAQHDRQYASHLRVKRS